MKSRLSPFAALTPLLALSASLLPICAYAQPTLTLNATVRDFLYNGTPAGTYNGYAGVGHPDFQNAISDDRGIVTTTLGVDGKPVYDSVAHPGGTSTTSGAANFDQWYNDTPGVNVPLNTTLVATLSGGVYTYANSSYFPIDGQGFGNQDSMTPTFNGGHNFAFTSEINTLFTYTGSGTFSFTGDDDVFVYINKQLVIDLGGVHGAETASVDLSTLGLTTGANYPLDIFQAERHTTESNFSFDTTLVLTPPSVPEPGVLVTGIALLGGTSFGLLRGRRKSQ